MLLLCPVPVQGLLAQLLHLCIDVLLQLWMWCDVTGNIYV